jgi:hypothetical protein
MRVRGRGEKRRARSQIVFNYRVLALLCDPISDRVPIYRAIRQSAALDEAIEGYADTSAARSNSSAFRRRASGVM